MPAFSRSEQWSVDASASDVRSRVVNALRRQRAKVVDSGGGRIEARSGSSVFARLDVSLVPKRWLPLRVLVSVTPDGGATRVAVTLEDGLGFGAAGSGSRYEELFEAMIAALRRATA